MSAKSIFWMIVLLVIGLTSGFVAVRDALELRRTARIWEGGKTALEPRADLAPATLGIESCGRLGGVAWDFDGKLSYQTTTGEPHRSTTRFFRLGSANEFSSNPAPGKVVYRGGSEPLEIRYLDAQRDEATVNWAYLGLRDGWIRVGFLAVVSVITLSMIVRVLRGDAVTVEVG